jgi:hypothetical protein
MRDLRNVLRRSRMNCQASPQRGSGARPPDCATCAKRASGSCSVAVVDRLRTGYSTPERVLTLVLCAPSRHRSDRCGRMPGRPADSLEVPSLRRSPRASNAVMGSCSRQEETVRRARTVIGATALRSPRAGSSPERTAKAVDATRGIARWAAKQIRSGETVLLDAGSTVAALARQLRSARNLTVATTSLAVLQELHHRGRRTGHRRSGGAAVSLTSGRMLPAAQGRSNRSGGPGLDRAAECRGPLVSADLRPEGMP